jgi:hypothetical protein
MTSFQLERRLVKLGVPALRIGESSLTHAATGETDHDGVPSSAVLIAYWWPKGSWLNRSGDSAELSIRLVTRGQAGDIRRAFRQVGVPQLAAWLTDAHGAGEGWKSLRHGKTWIWEERELRAVEFTPKARR